MRFRHVIDCEKTFELSYSIADEIDSMLVNYHTKRLDFPHKMALYYEQYLELKRRNDKPTMAKLNIVNGVRPALILIDFKSHSEGQGIHDTKYGTLEFKPVLSKVCVHTKLSYCHSILPCSRAFDAIKIVWKRKMF